MLFFSDSFEESPFILNPLFLNLYEFILSIGSKYNLSRKGFFELSSISEVINLFIYFFIFNL